MPRSKNTDPVDNILMGRVGAAHGLAGEVRITSFTRDPLSIAAYSPLLTDRDGLSVSILTARLSKNVVIAKLDGINDRAQAEALNGVELFVKRSALSDSQDEDEFLHADLIGLEARLQDGTVFGKIVAVPNYGAGDLVEIALPGGQTTLLAFTREVVREIHVEQGYIIVVVPEEIAGEEGR